MKRNLFLSAHLIIFFCSSSIGQTASDYLHEHAVRIEQPEHLSDSVYRLLSPYQLMMVGEMHGTKEPAQLVISLAKLLTGKGDSVQVGLEIPSMQMAKFIASPADSNLYRSDFFFNPTFESGRESFAWSGVISKLKNNPRVQLFYFDINEKEIPSYLRDSLMYVNIKKQFKQHPRWKMITLSGNAHNTITGNNSMTSYLKADEELKLSSKICALNHYYFEGTCRANFGNGLVLKRLGHPASVYDTTFSFENYMVLVSPTSTLPYTGIYYTRTVSAATMVKGNVDIPVLKQELSAIFERDQKTRSHGDSAGFMSYIDSCNLVQVEALISKYGWPGKSFIGGRGNNTVFLVIQHADLETQEKYLPLLEQSVADDESRLCDLALLQDRVLMRQGKKQIYGSQVVFNKITGAQEFYPIEDEINVNIRREKAGLPSMEEYGNFFGIDYHPPK